MARQRLLQLKNFFPRSSFCFGYGSGVLKQHNNDPVAKNMIDLIFAVEKPAEWHTENIKRNYSHYSFLKYGGAGFIADIQENYGASVYFNTMVKMDNMMIKYGVISKSSLITDLLDWNTLYISGRLHKPVRVLTEPDNVELSTALQINLQTAVHAALLMLPCNFEEEEMYKTICRLSYLGDFRMTFGEDKNKVNNIVKGQYREFQSMYKPLIKTFEQWIEIDLNGRVSQDVSPIAKLYHLSMLPKSLQNYLVTAWDENRKYGDVEDILRAISYDHDCNELIEKGIHSIVKKSSTTQSLKGIFTAGLTKATLYSSRKLEKMLRSFSK